MFGTSFNIDEFYRDQADEFEDEFEVSVWRSGSGLALVKL